MTALSLFPLNVDLMTLCHVQSCSCFICSVKVIIVGLFSILISKRYPLFGDFDAQLSDHNTVTLASPPLITGIHFNEHSVLNSSY